jgi:squalene-hopene/tetraprenyl-beta-curcumene cyclase
MSASACNHGNEVVLALPPSDDAAEAVAREALLFLLAQWQHGFAEAAHTLSFPAEQGFRGPEWIHTGDVFARALIADALLDAAALYGDAIAPVIHSECDYLLSRRRGGVAGGWSYFPGLAELPPDADDLAQIMTVLLRSGRADDIRAHCEGPLRVLLEECSHDDGSMETWIIPRHEKGPDEELQARWTAETWGRGADAEVVANVLHMLALYDAPRFAHVIERGAAWLAGLQSADGSWQSRWYEGPFYGTYAAVRVLTGRHDEAVQRAIAFAGRAHPEDPLNAALATLIAPRRNALPTASFPPIPFIRMELGRATGRVHQVLRYGSRCITAAFVLKAAVAVCRSSSS